MNENQNNQSNVISLEPKLAEKQLADFVQHGNEARDIVEEARIPAKQPEYSDAPLEETEQDSFASDNSPKPESTGNKRVISKGLAVAAGLLVVGGLVHDQLSSSDNVTEGYDNSAPSANYKVEAGDTLTGVATTVAENTPENETPTQAMEDIADRNVNVNANTQLSTEQILKLPSTADLDLQQPGVQLEKSE